MVKNHWQDIMPEYGTLIKDIRVYLHLKNQIGKDRAKKKDYYEYER